MRVKGKIMVSGLAEFEKIKLREIRWKCSVDKGHEVYSLEVRYGQETDLGVDPS